jgi:uncharacterized integral membrane protein (TIGR00698 family)
MNYLSPQWTLLFGIFISFFIQNSKIQNFAKQWSGKLLQVSVILLGSNLNFKSILIQGQTGVLITFFSISFVFIVGAIGIKLLKVERIQGILISMGTAICGGSAIGALAPLLNANSVQMTVSIGVIFLLNGIAVFIFPPIGQFFELSQDQFGFWAALAIHDTSSVVAATTIYGSKALEVGTLIKLIRALWIIPTVIGFALFFRTKDLTKLKFPWFIIGFVLMSVIFTFIDMPRDFQSTLGQTAKLGFAITLFLIGLSLNLVQMKIVGLKPLVFGTALWITTSVASLSLILYFY